MLCNTCKPVRAAFGHEEACQLPRRHDRSPSRSRRNRDSAEVFRVVPGRGFRTDAQGLVLRPLPPTIEERSVQCNATSTVHPAKMSWSDCFFAVQPAIRYPKNNGIAENI